MLEELLQYRGLAAFSSYGALICVAVCELVLARRTPQRVARRWLSNFAIGAIDRAATRWILPLGALALALAGAESQIGLLHAIAAPPLAAFLVTLLALDLIAYATHRL